jgi:hypothetical protein
MKRNDRVLFALLFGIPLLLVVPVALIGSSLSFEPGRIEVQVLDKHGGGSVGVNAPALLVPLAMHLAPDVVIDDMRCELGEEGEQALAIARAAVRELARCPDGILVDVRTRDEVIFVEKKGRAFLVHVDTPGETVHATIPLSAIGSVLDAI